HVEIGGMQSVYTHDFMRMKDVLPERDGLIHLANGVPYAPYAFGFYLPGHFLAPQATADYVISADPSFLPANLTPRNERLFLFDASP
ncbi:MAG TPA: hypothetical protein VFI11_15325, partial [Anaerolineales bacterium]|nr:hypothetical protein [Anaerolineales bacterium]